MGWLQFQARNPDGTCTGYDLYHRSDGYAEMLGVSVGHAYKLIRKLNQELEKEGFLVIAGKVPRRYFEKRWYGFSA